MELLLKLIGETEAEAKAHRAGWGVAPWYYEQLAILYRKEKRHVDEVEILERFESQPKAPGVGPGRLAARLVKARRLEMHVMPNHAVWRQRSAGSTDAPAAWPDSRRNEVQRAPADAKP